MRADRRGTVADWLEAVPTFTPGDTATRALANVRHNGLPAGRALYVVDDGQHLVGVVPVEALLRAKDDQPLAELMRAPVAVVPITTHQERVASTALNHALAEIPIVDGSGHFAGIVPTHALLQILRHEHVEDLHRMAGIRREALHARAAMEAPAVRRVRDRLPWLLVGLAGSSVATGLVSAFESTLEARVAVAFFMPGLVYLTDAIGTQTEAVVVRGLSLSHRPWKRLFGGELRTGLLMGAALAVIAFFGTFAAYRDLRLATAIAVTIVTAGVTACTVGFALPSVLARTGRDPAFGSGPLGTIIQDVLTLAIYFAAVRLLL